MIKLPETVHFDATGRPLYAATKVQALLLASREEAMEAGERARIDLLIQVDNLCSQIENTLYKLRGDDEAMRQATGAVMHAKSKAHPYRRALSKGNQ